MKTFAATLLFAAFVSAKDLPDAELPVADVDADGEFDLVDLTPEEIEAAKWDALTEKMYYSRNLWLGVFQGLYGVAGSVERPDDKCFGKWIPDKMQELSLFLRHLKMGPFMVDMDEAQAAAYDAVDLLFLNDNYCHFRQAWIDVRRYCQNEDVNCGMGGILENMQKNAFNIITQVSSAASLFKDQPWEEMDKNARGYSLNQAGHSVAALYADLIGFNGSKVVREEIIA